MGRRREGGKEGEEMGGRVGWGGDGREGRMGRRREGGKEGKEE